jgi:hypothetical protein
MVHADATRKCSGYMPLAVKMLANPLNRTILGTAVRVDTTGKQGIRNPVGACWRGAIDQGRLIKRCAYPSKLSVWIISSANKLDIYCNGAVVSANEVDRTPK